jgi:hypothetical protein
MNFAITIDCVWIILMVLNSVLDFKADRRVLGVFYVLMAFVWVGFLIRDVLKVIHL